MLVEAAFKSVDKDGSGYLEMEELKLLMGSIATALGVEVKFIMISHPQGMKSKKYSMN